MSSSIIHSARFPAKVCQTFKNDKAFNLLNFLPFVLLVMETFAKLEVKLKFEFWFKITCGKRA